MPKASVGHLAVSKNHNKQDGAHLHTAVLYQTGPPRSALLKRLLVAGTALVGVSLAVPPGFAIGATLDLNGVDTTLPDGVVFTNPWLDGGNNVTNGNATGAMVTEGGGVGVTYSGVISDGAGTTGWTHTGGSVIVTGINTYSGATTISGGTLQAGAGGAFSSNSAFTVAAGAQLDISGISQSIFSLAGLGDVANFTNFVPSNTASVLAIVGGGTTSFAGTLTDGVVPLGLTLSNNSTLTLTNSGGNTYSFGTTIDNGSTLSAGNINAFSANSTVTANGILDLNGYSQAIASLAGSGSVTNVANTGLGAPAILTIQGGLSTAFDGMITDGAGQTGLTLTNASTLTLTNSGGNTYSGATQIDALSTLSAGNINVFSGNSAVTANGTVDLGGFSQTIGSLAGAGTITNNGASNATLTEGGDNSSTTFSGIIQDGSKITALTKVSSGTTVLTGINAYTGATTVNGGTLSINGSTASALTNVNSSGTLGGTGTVGGVGSTTNINNGGALAPGNSIGTITINGNLAFNASSNYNVEISPATSDKTTVNGTATLTGGTVNATFQVSTYAAKNYTILTSTGLGATTFAGLTTTSLPTNFQAKLAYTTTDVNLDLTAALGSGSTGGFSSNQQIIINTLNNYFNNGNPLPPSFVTLYGLTGSQLSNALNQLTGQSNGGIVLAGNTLTNSFLGLIFNPFAGAQSGGSGSAIGYAREFGAGAVSPEATSAYAAVTPKDLRPDTFDRRWSIWAQGYGGYNKTDGNTTAGTNDTTTHTYGVTTGFDFHANPDLLLGFALAGGGTNWDLSQGLGGGRSNVFQTALYGTQRFGAAYLAGALSYAWHDVTTDRTVTVAGTDKLEAKFHAHNIGGRIEGGYRFDTPYIAVTPYSAFQAQSTHTPAYTEMAVSGSNAFALSFNSNTSTSTRFELGSWLDKLIALSQEDAIAVRGRVAWAHDHASSQTINAAFQTLPGTSFTVNGAQAPTNLALLTTGAEYRLANGFSVGARFDTELASHSQTYAGTGTIRYAW